jgi:hypothetical protein
MSDPMIIPFINVPFSSIHLYQKPISMRFGEKKLLEICRSTLEREPRVNELFLFYNGKRNTLKLFWLDGTGSQELSKSLPRGGFLLPAPKDEETFVKLERAKLNSLFRS